jgi:hypothetical protein
MAVNPFQFPYVSGVPKTDFHSTFSGTDAAKTDTMGIGMPRSWGGFAYDFATNPMGTIAAGVQSYITRGVFIVIGLALIIIAVWQLSRGQTVAILEQPAKAA